METIDLADLDRDLLATNKTQQANAFVHDAILKTSELLLQEREPGMPQIYRIALLIESQLRLRQISNVQPFQKDLKSGLSFQGLCSIEVIMHTLEEI